MGSSIADASTRVEEARSPHPRYRLLQRIGQGGMGEVFKAQDRLTGQLVALKRVRVPVRSVNVAFARDDVKGRTNLAHAATIAPLSMTVAATNSAQLPQGDTQPPRDVFDHAESAESYALRVHLTQEFHTLAGLRHPHIVSVLDYGFAGDHQPFFTMEFLDGATPLDEAARGQPLAVQVGLLLQTLQALTYLHRRGILHRDLKPGNILIVSGPRGPQVKLLDFGLALLASGLDAERAQVAGTIGYMAPEIFAGAPASEASDLFAVGVMAHQILSGSHPFGDQRTPDQGTSPIVSESPRLGSALLAVLRRALCRAPAERYTDATTFGRELARAIGQESPAETTEIRESFLQAATFVARERELATLQQALDAAASGHGAVWLVGGESGVGKSRLLEELRTRALVRGATVLRGQAVSAGGGAYQVWQGILRPLCLDATLDDLDAGVLGSVVPDIATLLDRAVPAPPEIDPQTAQARFLSAVERLLLSQQVLKVLLLEDLQWAEPASLAVLQRLLQRVAHHPILIVGSYRQDERPTLLQEVPGARSLPLQRLSAQELAQLSTSMLGTAGRRLELVTMLGRETEGNVSTTHLLPSLRRCNGTAGVLDWAWAAGFLAEGKEATSRAACPHAR